MAKAKAKKPKIEDEDQSRRFIAAAEAVQADGGRSPTGAQDMFERLLSRAAPVRTRKKATGNPGGQGVDPNSDRQRQPE